MIKLFIDHRESELKKYFDKKDNVFFSNLDVGDIQFTFNDEIVQVIERKNITDLATSIKDGRYREQKMRLLNNIDRNKIIYLIEGNIRVGNIAGLPHTTLLGSMINAMLRDNIKVYRTNNLDESICFIELILSKLSKDGSKLIYNGNNDDNVVDKNIEYVSSIKVKKKENMTESNCFLLQLSQIPGVSINIANAIHSNYHSMLYLCKKYDSFDNDSDKINLLKDISFNIANEKTRKIGKVVSERVYKFLTSSEKI